MKIVKNAYQEVMDFLGCQKNNGSEHFHKSVFVIEQNVSDGQLLYNTFTGEIILLEKDESNLQFLINRWYYISNEDNEFDILNKFRSKLISLEYNKPITTFTIFPTTDCNANCFYCFEQGRQKKNMTIETCMVVTDYIVKNSKGCNVNIRWFGGEPLYNRIAVDTICSVLNDEGVHFSSKMATNGFLFTPNVIDKAYSNWHLKQVQITLDGTEQKYSSIKQYKCNSQINPFERVINNINELVLRGIDVVIRLNLDINNVGDQEKLVNWLFINFNNQQRISIYTHLLMNSLRSDNGQDHCQLFEIKSKLDDLIYEKGFSCHTQIRKRFKLHRCISDDEESITILPDGKIGLCEHYTDDHFISDLQEQDMVNLNEVKFLREQLPLIDLCLDCAFYPYCIRLRCCPDSGVCFKELKQQRINNLQKELLAEYRLNNNK